MKWLNGFRIPVLLTSIVFLIISGVMLPGGIFWPWGWAIAIVSFFFCFKSSAEKNGYRF